MFIECQRYITFDLNVNNSIYSIIKCIISDVSILNRLIQRGSFPGTTHCNFVKRVQYNNSPDPKSSSMHQHGIFRRIKSIPICEGEITAALLHMETYNSGKSVTIDIFEFTSPLSPLWLLETVGIRDEDIAIIQQPEHLHLFSNKVLMSLLQSPKAFMLSEYHSVQKYRVLYYKWLQITITVLQSINTLVIVEKLSFLVFYRLRYSLLLTFAVTKRMQSCPSSSSYGFGTCTGACCCLRPHQCKPPSLTLCLF